MVDDAVVVAVVVVVVVVGSVVGDVLIGLAVVDLYLDRRNHLNKLPLTSVSTGNISTQHLGVSVFQNEYLSMTDQKLQMVLMGLE